ncbi:hypothetical protein ABZ424_19340 [Streptomyces sp. NPDC005790]|uniref:hypothetical protein n=1 Tax=Streptomyces sp. NPDC005790 TaxID=3154777 RepID=UPI0033EE62C7
MSSGEDAALEAMTVPGGPVRRGLYRHVANTPGEVGRDAAAEAAGISRSPAAFHLGPGAFTFQAPHPPPAGLG